jgi:hypothetical protein
LQSRPGYDGKDQLKSAEYYDEKTFSWQKLADMNFKRRSVVLCLVPAFFTVPDFSALQRLLLRCGGWPSVRHWRLRW